MKKVLKKFNRTLSIMLAAAMVLTMVPQTAMPVLAAEEEIEATAEETPEVVDEDTADDAEESTESEDVVDTGEEAENPTDDEQNNEEEEGSEELPGDNDTPVIETPDEEPVVDPVEEPTEKEVVDPTTATLDSATVTAAGDTHTIEVTGDVDMVEYALPDDGSYTEEENAEGNYTFTITAKDTYQIDSVTYKVGDSGEEKTLTVEDGSYSIPKSEIKDDVTITVTASKIQYTVTSTVTVDDTPVTDFDSNETISFSTTATDGKIDAGSNLTINASLKDAAKATHKISKVAYKVGDDGEEVDLTEGWKGTTTISDVRGNVAITVTVEELETYAVDFGNHNDIAKVTDIEINGEAAETNEFNSETEGDWKISATEGSKVSFKLEAEEPFQIDKVLAGTTELTPVAGVYTIESLEADTSVTAETSLDRAQVGRFTFNMATGSDRQTATMTVTVPDGVSDDDDTADTYNAGDPEKLTRLEKIIVSFEAVDGYELGKVYVNGDEIDPIQQDGDQDEEPGEETQAEGDESPAQYEVSLAKGEDTKITVETDAIGSEAEKYFGITNNASHLSLDEVKADTTAITPAAEGDNEGKYPVAAGTKRVTFSLTTADAYEPIVKATIKATEENGEDTVSDVPAYDITTAAGKTTYSYMILASRLADEYTITEQRAIKTISFIDADNVDVSIDGRLVNVPSADDENQGIEYVQGRRLTVKVAAKENAILNSVIYTIGDANEVKPKVTKNVAEFTLTLTDNTVVTIDATGELVALPLEDENGEALTPVKNAYSVSYDGIYRAAIGEGVDAVLVTPTEAKLFSGNTEVTAAEGKSAVVSIKDSKAEVNLGNADVTAVSGKSLTLKVTVGAGDDAKTFAYTLQVTKAITTASDITVSAKANQPTDTVKTYAVSTKGEISRLSAKVDAEAITAGYIAKQPEIVEGKLVITTGQTVTPAEGVKVTVYTGEGENEISKDVLVKTTALISDTTTAPKVTLKSATDIDMTLSMSAKTDADVAVGGVYYKVTATAAGTVPAGLESTVTEYVPKTGDAQDYTLNVASDGTALGSGGACDYKVTVSLVHAKTKGVEPTTEETTVAESKAFATADNKPFATQNPAWEANLKLKKGTTTIYTGQTGVSIATPQFTKTTTYTGIVANNVSDLTYRGSSALTFTVEDGVIKASASAGTAVGKHTVQVVAVADDANSMVASKATIVITVVKGINTLGVSVPTISLYKAVNKAATVKATAIYNNDATGKDKTLQPKTKKVKWDVVAYKEDHSDGEDTLFGNGKVTVKNGTVTVAKDYVIQASSAANTFQIRVTVDNDKTTIGDAKAAYSAPIEITNEALDMDRLVIVGSDNKVVAISNESKPKTEVSVEATDLNGATVKIVDESASVKEGETYNVSASDEILATNLTYKSSKAKDVIFGEKAVNSLTVAKANTKPTLTVTANDGSKATLGIKLNVGYDSAVGELALMIADEYGTVYDPSRDTATTVSYKGNATNLLSVRLMEKDEEGNWSVAPEFTNYDVKVANGKKISQTGTDAEITTDKAEVKITLTDKSKTPAATTTYTLTNSNFVASGTKVTAKVIGSLRQSATAAEQDVKLELGIPAEFAATLSGDSKDAAVWVDVDWSKLTLKNADALLDFADSLTKLYEEINYDSATNKATVQLKVAGNVNYLQSSYALKVSVGSVADDVFTAAAPAVAATVKVEKTKKFTFKPTTSYTIATRDGGVAIGGKASIPTDDLVLENLRLQNANFGGAANNFTKYFEIADGKLQLIDGVTVADLLDKANKNDLTGYLTYTARSNKSYYEYSTGTGTNTVKITVKVNDTKAVAKYTTAQGEIMNKAGATATVEVLANKAPVKIAAAKLFISGTKTDECFDTTAKLVDDEGNIVLTLKDAVAANKSTVKATVNVIPEDSFYAGMFAADKNPVDEDYVRYGVQVTITLKVKQPTTLTLAQAKTAVEDWVADVEADAPAWLTDKDANNLSMQESILNAVNVAVAADNVDIAIYSSADDADDTDNGNEPETPDESANADDADNTATTYDDFSFTAANESAAGSVKGTLKITVDGASEFVAFNFTIPKWEEEQPATPTVTSVEIQKDGSAVTAIDAAPGETITFTAKVTGTDLTEGTNDTVTWTLENYSGSSTINNGSLVIDNDESESMLTVKATSTLDSTKSATVTVTVKQSEDNEDGNEGNGDEGDA